jgi:Transposase DDE domain
VARQPPEAALLLLHRKQEQIAAEAALDGIYVLCTSVPGAELEAPDVVRAYKQLKEVERAFRTLKGPLELRAIHGRLEQRVKAHVFFSMLSPTTSPGTCAGPGSRCCSTTSSRRPGRTRSPGRAAPPPPSARPDQAHHRGRALPLARHSAHRPLDPRPNTIRLQDPGASFEQLTQPTPTEARALG